jgi:hypothetical protein
MWSTMGQDNSAPTLEKDTLDGVASYIKKGKARKIVVMVLLHILVRMGF